MASFKAKTGRDQLRMRGKKILSFQSIQIRSGIGNSKKIVKKFKKWKIIIMDSFQSETGWDRLRMRQKNKIIVPIHSISNQNREFQKNRKNNKKI